LHGHDYAVKLQIAYHSKFFDHTLDFRIVNNLVKNIIEELDHKIILPGNSQSMKILPERRGENWHISILGKEYSFPKKDVKIIDDVEQTTCENIARFLHKKITMKLKEVDESKALSHLTVILSETEGNEVKYSSKIV